MFLSFITLSFFATSYFMATFQEWVIHKYLMHNHNTLIKSIYNNHQYHHKIIKSDYSIQSLEDSKYICQNIISIDGLLQFIIILSINTTFLYQLFSPYI